MTGCQVEADRTQAQPEHRWETTINRDVCGPNLLRPLCWDHYARVAFWRPGDLCRCEHVREERRWNPQRSMNVRSFAPCLQRSLKSQARRRRLCSSRIEVSAADRANPPFPNLRQRRAIETAQKSPVGTHTGIYPQCGW